MDIHYKKKNSCNRKELLVDILEDDGRFTRGSVIDCSETGLLVEFGSRNRQPEVVSITSCYAVEDESDEEVTEANYDCKCPVKVLLRENEGDPERWYPCRVLQLQPTTGWAYTPRGRWQLAKVELGNSKHAEILVNDGPFWLHRRLRKRMPEDCVMQDTFQKVRIDLPARDVEAVAMFAGGDFRYRWINRTGTALVRCCPEEGCIYVICRVDMIRYFVSYIERGFMTLVRRYRDREEPEDNLPLYSRLPSNTWGTDEGKLTDLSDLEFVEISQYLDICERIYFSKVSPYLHRILRSRYLERELIIQADTFIDNSYYLALCLSRCATPTTKVICLIGKYFKCILALARVLEHRNVELNYLVIANNKHVTPDDFIDCYDTFLMRPELTNVCRYVVLKNSVMNFDRCTSFRDGRKGTLPCGDVCNPTFKFNVFFLKFSCRNGSASERTKEFYAELDRLCEPSEGDRTQLSEELDALDNIDNGKFELLARAFEKFHLERPICNVAWIKMIRFRKLACANLVHHTIVSWLQQKPSSAWTIAIL